MKFVLEYFEKSYPEISLSERFHRYGVYVSSIYVPTIFGRETQRAREFANLANPSEWPDTGFE